MTGQDLTALLARLDLTQNEAAWACDVNPRTFRRWVSGEIAPVPGSAATLLLVMEDQRLSLDDIGAARKLAQ